MPAGTDGPVYPFSDFLHLLPRADRCLFRGVKVGRTFVSYSQAIVPLLSRLTPLQQEKLYCRNVRLSDFERKVLDKMNVAGPSVLIAEPERRIVYFCDPETLNLLVGFTTPSPKEMEALDAIVFVMQLIRFSYLAFLSPTTPLLLRLELAFRASYRLQLWTWDRTRRKESGAALTPACFAGYVQNAESLFLLCKETLERELNLPIHPWLMGSQVQAC